MDRITWIYPDSEEEPDQGEEVLCDLGRTFSFIIMMYDEGIFLDQYVGEYYNLGTDIKRWAHIGKHYDE